MAAACSLISPACNDGAVVTARTLDYDGLNFFDLSSLNYAPVGSTFPTQLPIANQTTHTAKYGYVLQKADLVENSSTWVLDGMNTQGLSLSLLYQYVVPFHARFNASSRATQQVNLLDLFTYSLAMFSSVKEVREFLNPETMQITTHFDGPTAESVNAMFSGDPDIPSPDPDGTFYVPAHVHYADGSGDSILVEGTSNDSYAVYDTRVVTNEPSYPEIVQQREAWLKANFSGLPGVTPAPLPTLPAVIPFNSGVDNKRIGDWGSTARNLRLWLTLQNCSSYPWPHYSWSPGDTNFTDSAQKLPPPGSFRALKRAENFIGSVVVPMSQLATDGVEAGEDLYATEGIAMKDSTDRVYYYKSAQNNNWFSVDLKKLENSTIALTFPFGPQDTPFSIDVTPTSGSGSKVSLRVSLSLSMIMTLLYVLGPS